MTWYFVRQMTYEGLLIFRFHMNPNRMTIPVIGQGILPHVHIIGPNVSFPPTLPWAERTDIYFGLTNPCPFPLELIFAHSDQWVPITPLNRTYLITKWCNGHSVSIYFNFTGNGSKRTIFINYCLNITTNLKKCWYQQLNQAQGCHTKYTLSSKSLQTMSKSRNNNFILVWLCS